MSKQSTYLVVQLNDRWRVVDETIQWILEVRKGRPSAKATGWRGEHFCRQRTSLLRCIREYCGDVDPKALAVIEALPDWHVDRDRINAADQENMGKRSHG